MEEEKRDEKGKDGGGGRGGGGGGWGGFFFQAGDGIRDRLVTGVQTCALPVFHRGESVPGAHVDLRICQLEPEPYAAAPEALWEGHVQLGPTVRAAGKEGLEDGQRQTGSAARRARV